jgi:hypothetical protein
MGSSSTLGLLFEISADASQAQAELARFQGQFAPWLDSLTKGTQAMGKSGLAAGQDAAKGLDKTGASALQSRYAVMALADQFGLHLPRALATSLSQMELLQRVATVAFSAMAVIYLIENIGKMAKAIGSAALELGGFSKQMQGLYKQEEEFNTWLITRSKARLENEIKLNLDARARIRTGIAAVTAEMERSEVAGTNNVIMYKGMNIAAEGHRAVTTGLKVELGRLKDELQANEAASEKYNLELAKLQETEKKTTKEHKEHTKVIKEEKGEVGDIARLFGDLSLAVYATDSDYREYLKTLNAINRIHDDHSRIILAMLNDERLALALDKQRDDLTKEQIKLSADLVKGLHLEKESEDQLTEAEKRAAVFMRQLTDRSRELRQEWILERTQLRLMSTDLYGMYVPAFQAAGATMENFRVVGMNALADFQRGMASNIAQAIVYQKSIGEAFLAALKAAAASMAAEAILQALKATALGFYLLAVQDYSGAAAAFKSAVLWGALGGAAAIAGRAIPSGEKATGAAGPGAYAPAPSGPRYAVAPGTSGLLAPGAAGPAPRLGGNVSIMVLPNSAAGRAVAALLETHVVQNRGRLIASESLNPPTASH